MLTTTQNKSKMKFNIEVFLKEQELTHPFNPNLLSEEFSQYLENCCLHRNLRNGINLRIHGANNEEQKIKISQLIHTHYNHELEKSRQGISRVRLMRFVLLLVGIAAIVISEATPRFLEAQRLISELFMIAGWVFIWELIYDIVFSRSRRLENANIINKLAICSIEFVD